MSGEPEQTPLVLFRISCVLAVFMTGYLVHAGRTWPHSLIQDGFAGLRDVILNAKAYAGYEPTLELYESPGDGDGITRLAAGKVADGLIFMSGFFDRKTSMKLITSDGRLINRWDVSYTSIFSDSSHVLPATARPLSDWNTNIHGAMPLPDGSVVFTFDAYGLARVDKCGNVMWKLPRMANHSVSMGDDGTLWVPSRIYHAATDKRLPLHRAPFFEDQILRVSKDGEVLREISLPELLINNGLAGLLYASGHESVGTEIADYMHVNDADVLTRDIAAAFPNFAAGDIAVSMRNLNLIIVFDPLTAKIKWYQTGPWLRQHDPDFLADGTISVFDNRKDDTLRGSLLKGSAITQIDPVSRSIRVAYAQAKTADDLGFYTFIMGKHQHLSNGNMMISQPTYGRAFEVTKAGELVWEYMNRFDKDRVALLTEATRYPETYFKVQDWSCKQEGALQ